jgi:Flp pilus assembly protein TadG
MPLPPANTTRDLWRDTDGASAVLIGLSMTVLMGFAGLAVDAGVWYGDKRNAQGAADAAAYSAAIDSATGDTTAGVKSAARAITAQYGMTDGSGGVAVTVNTPPASGPNTGNAKAVEVIIARSEPLFFSSLFIQNASMKARAVGISGSAGGKFCVAALNPTTSNSVSTVVLSGSVTLNLQTCGLQVNAGGSDAMNLSGSVTVNAGYVSIVGNYMKSGAVTMNITGALTTAAPSVADPYVNVPTQAAGACTATNASYSGSAVATLSPGTYCNGLSLSGSANIKLNPGVYIISGGSLSVSGTSTLDGSAGVTIVLTGTGSNFATASISGTSTVKLTAPTTGATAGLAMFGDRNAPTSGTDTISGGSGLSITGALYFPTQTVKFSGNTATGAAGCTQLIAYDLVFSGDATLGANCAGTGVKGIGASASTLAE